MVFSVKRWYRSIWDMQPSGLTAIMRRSKSSCGPPIYPTNGPARERCLLGLGQTDSALAKVIHAVPLPQERISQDGQRAHRLREVQAHEGTDAVARDLERVVVRGDGEVVAAQDKAHVRQRRALVAVDRVLAGQALLGTDLLVARICQREL